MLGPYVGIDLCGKKIKVVIAEFEREDSDEPIIKGTGEADSNGISFGTIVDRVEAARSISEAISKAQNLANQNINSASVSICGMNIETEISFGEYLNSNPKKSINAEMLNSAIEMAKRNSGVPENREIIQSIQTCFYLDGAEIDTTPVGLYGSKLCVENMTVSCPFGIVSTLIETFRDTGIEIKANQIYPNVLSSACCVVDVRDLKNGLLLINLGMETTDFAIFQGNKILYLDCIGKGGNYISKMVSRFFNMSISEAENFILEYGNLSPDEKTMSKNNPSSIYNYSFNKNELSRVLIPFYDTLFEYILKSIRNNIDTNVGFEKIILTGEGAQIRGIADCYKLISPNYVNVEIGLPKKISGTISRMNNPVYSSAIGLTILEKNSRTRKDLYHKSQKSSKGGLSKVTNFLYKLSEEIIGITKNF